MRNLNQTTATTEKKLLLFTHNCDADSVLAEDLQMGGFRVQLQDLHLLNNEPLRSFQPDLVLIDLGNPSLEYLNSCKTIRANCRVPILMLAEQANEMFQVLGLELGADDFLIKPLPTTLLLAKVRALLRREEESRHQHKNLIQLGELVIDAGRREVWCSGSNIQLTAREFDLLWCLAENAQTILSRDKIHQLLYNSEYNGFDRSIDIYISRIRQKIGDDPLNPRYLKTIRGAGYLLVDSKLCLTGE